MNRVSWQKHAEGLYEMLRDRIKEVEDEGGMRESLAALETEVAELRAGKRWFCDADEWAAVQAKIAALESRNRALVEALRVADNLLRRFDNNRSVQFTSDLIELDRYLDMRAKAALANDAKEKP